MALIDESRQYVSPAGSNELLSRLEKLPGDPSLGFFGPDSLSWRISRESAIFLGAGRAALLQLAHPWVAASLLHHSNLLNDAIGRFHSTFRVIYTMIFGTRAQAVAASRQLYRLHSGIKGQLPNTVGAHPRGEHYEANEVRALSWVYATLIESAILAYEFVMPSLTPSEREQYYAESKGMAALFSLPPEALPADWRAFTQYTAEMFESSSLGVDQNALSLGRSVLSGAGTWVHPPRWYNALTAFWMPPRLREGFELPFGPAEEQSLHRLKRHFPRLYRRIPHAFRFVGPYLEAKARLRGCPPGPFTRASNRFWMGQPCLLYSELSRDSHLV
jgi:uncharacterized protein (DUF2236 family)